MRSQSVGGCLEYGFGVSFSGYPDFTTGCGWFRQSPKALYDYAAPIAKLPVNHKMLVWLREHFRGAASTLASRCELTCDAMVGLLILPLVGELEAN